MKIQYWAAANMFGNTINFSVTGEGAIEEECYENALIQVKEEVRFSSNCDLQKVAIITK